MPESIHSDIGKIIFSAEFKDKRGLNIVYASQYTPFNYGNKSYIDKIWIKQYLFDGKNWDLKWTINDFAPNALSSLSFKEKTFSVFDIDGDGIAEIGFFYEINFEGADPSILKYIVHKNDKKYVIRGTLPVSEDMNEYTKVFDPAIVHSSPALQEYASKEWDSFVKEYFKNM